MRTISQTKCALLVSIPSQMEWIPLFLSACVRSVLNINAAHQIMHHNGGNPAGRPAPHSTQIKVDTVREPRGILPRKWLICIDNRHYSNYRSALCVGYVCMHTYKYYMWARTMSGFPVYILHRRAHFMGEELIFLYIRISVWAELTQLSAMRAAASACVGCCLGREAEAASPSRIM
jgi:hypothetical protein